MSTPEWAPLKNGIWSAPPARGLAETEPHSPSLEPEPEQEPEDQPLPPPPVSFAQPHSPSPEPEPEQPPEDDQVVPTGGVASFAQPHSPSPSPVNDNGPPHPDDIQDENPGPDDEPELDENGYEVDDRMVSNDEYRGGYCTYSIYNKDEYVEEDIRNYDD